MNPLSERDRRVLEAVILLYTETGEPVGSRTISKKTGLNLSSATIRNVMSDLEDLGFLTQPHTSAGRIPTAGGLRHYIDYIMQTTRLSGPDRSQIEQAFQESKGDMEEVLRRTSHILSRLCNQVGVVLWPRYSLMRLKRIQFVLLRPKMIMMILVSRSGVVQHTVFDWIEDTSQDELDKYSRYLSSLLEDVPFSDLRFRILEEMKNEKVLFDQLYQRALEMTQQALKAEVDSTHVYIGGRTNLFQNPEFEDVERMRRILETFEDKSRIIRLLDRALAGSEDTQVLLGSESDEEGLKEISLISSPYRRGDVVLGVLGVIGPLRMNYSRLVPVVNYTANALSRTLRSEK